MEEKNIISEEALEKAAGGLHLNKDTLKKCLIAGGVLAAAGAAGVGGYYLYNKKKGSAKVAQDLSGANGKAAVNMAESATNPSEVNDTLETE